MVRSVAGRASLMGAVASLALFGAAQAQDAGTLEEIIVTAQKREQNLQDVPVSVATLGGDVLQNVSAGGADIRFLSARVPSLTAESSFGRTFPRFYIRGLGNTDFDLNASQPVSLVYDNVVLENPALKGMPAFDLERVEVLRGPQGTLFGRNTPAGIIQLVSKKPTDETEGYASLSYGRWNAMEAEGAVGGSLIEGKVKGRVSFLHQRRDGYVDNSFTGENDSLEGYEDTAARVQVEFTPNDRLTVLVNGHMRSLDGTARVFRANIIKPGTNDLVDGFSPYKAALDGGNDQEVNQRGVSIDAAYDFGPVTLTSITAYEYVDVFSRGDVDGSFTGDPGIPFPAESASVIPGVDQVSQELRLSSNDSGPLKWQGGFFYFHDNVHFQNINYGNATHPLGWSTVAYSRQKNDAWALFGQASYDVTDRLTLTAGLRYTDDQKDLNKYTVFYNQVGRPVTTDPKVSKSDSKVSWDVAADYLITDGVHGFARIATGFRAPSIQPRTDPGVPSTTANSETVTSYEAGVKSDLWGRRARLNLTGFYYEVKDQQFTAVGGASNANTLLNADKGIGAGFEAELEVKPVENLLLTAGTSYNYTEIKDSDVAVGTCRSCTVTDPLVTRGGRTLALIDGNPFPQAPRWIVNTTARYGIPLGDGELYGFTDWAYKTSANFFLYESKEFHSKAYWLGGLRVGYNHDDRFDISAFVRNLTNEKQLEGGIDFNNLTGFIIEPRTYGVTASMRF
ncbi:TonB-dependent receptor [Oleisolibacter albus]|uniref:TonB-dependent receptor n=1 Tax=Oleisolibacter albus TaxID=2171757 RepID=UPI000DF1828D|nr:TonB-dependent receptor [Oleisolibacter albus]